MTIEARKIRLLMELRRAGIADTAVLGAMEKLPRELFVPSAFRDKAYDDTALPVGQGRTIDPPFLSAALAEALQVEKRHTVLEIGTGCGYQTALLAMLARRVYSIDPERELQRQAETIFAGLKLSNIVLKPDNGRQGWPEQAPFDRIIVSAAVTEPPAGLLAQLGEDGFLLIAVISSGKQTMTRFTRAAAGFTKEALFPSSFPQLAIGGPT